MKKIRLYEAFAGVGSQHKAFERLQNKKDNKFTLELAGISEWDVYAVMSYFAMNGYEYSGVDLNVEDIREYLETKNYSIDGKELASSLNSLSDKYIKMLFEAERILKNDSDISKIEGRDLINKNIDVFTYSFPCQDLSNAGKGAGMSKGSSTRSGLLWEVERVLNELHDLNKEKLPKFLILENVPQIISEKNKPDYDEWIKSLNEFGYTTFSGVLNSLDTEIPQSRKRFFAVSILNYNGNISNDKSLREIIDKLKYSKNILKKKTLKSYLKLDYSNDLYLSEALDATPNHTKSRMKMILKEKSLTKIYNDKVIALTKKDNESIFSNTITTKQDRWGNAGMVHFNYKIFDDNTRSIKRYITPREAFLLMGYDEKSVQRVLNLGFPNNRYYIQAGNSIVVNVLEDIFDIFIVNYNQFILYDDFN